MKDRAPRKDINSSGFTLVELMISLSVLSLILLMGAMIMTQIGKWYSKGVNSANVQNVSRTVSSDIVSAIQFSGTSPRTGTGGAGGASAYCLDKVRYTYVLNRKLGGNTGGSAANHVLWRDVMRTSANCTPLDLSASRPSDSNTDTSVGGFELLSNNMRLTQLRVTDNPVGSGIYAVEVNMAYGSDEVVRSNAGRASCLGGAGTEYCAVANHSTSVNRRLK